MGYTHGIEWSEELVIEKLKEVIEHLDLKTFPTKTEIISYFHNRALVAKIARYGGVKYWANRLGLPLKDCESKMGEKYEQMCLSKLQELGFNVETMKARYPYDLAVNSHIKVDVKSGFLFKTKVNSSYYTFNLEKSFPSCDIFVVYCLNEDDTIRKTYVIPSVFLFGLTQLSMGVNNTKYEKFVDRWDYFDTYNKFYENLLKENQE